MTSLSFFLEIWVAGSLAILSASCGLCALFGFTLQNSLVRLNPRDLGRLSVVFGIVFYLIVWLVP